MADEDVWTFPSAGLGGGAVAIGVDIFERERLRQSYARHGERLLRRLFTPLEVEQAKGDILRLASRFAAKEACAKALGTGIRHGVWWRDMGVVNLPGGRPTLILTGGAKVRLDALTPPGFEARIDLSITDEWPMAQAFVIISAVIADKP